MNKLITLIAIIIVFRSGTVNAQTIEWQNTIGGNERDILSEICQTDDGGFICGGYSRSDSTGDKTEDALGDYDYWIVKLDASGNMEWQNTIGGNLDDQLNSIMQTNDGGYICGGYSNSGVMWDKTENTNGGNDFWVIKLDSAGNIEWQNSIGGSLSDILVNITETADSGFICGGFSTSPISGDKTENGQGSSDYWVVKLNSTGAIEWQNTIGGSGTDYLRSIITTADGGYLCGGTSTSYISGDKTENAIGIYDIWILKLDSIGNIQWQNTIGGIETDDVQSLRQTSDGGYVCGGSSDSGISGDKTEVNFGSTDFWVLKLDSSGAILWQNTIGGNEWDELFDMDMLANGGFLCTGRSESNISGDKNENSISNSFDFWLVQLDSNGILLWQKTIGGSAYEVITTTLQTTDGDYILGGHSQSGISGDKTEVCQGLDDYWIIKLDGDFNLINGITYADLNSNNIQDTNETVIPNKMITETATGSFAFTNQYGQYSLAIQDSGNYQAAPSLTAYYTPSPANHAVYFSGTAQIDSLNNFALQPAAAINDLCVNLSPLTAFRSGMNAWYLIEYFNYGTTTLNPTVVFYPDTNIGYSSSSPSPTTITTDSIVYTFGPLAPFHHGQILIKVNVDWGLPWGTLINSHADILPVINDANPQCNQDYWETVTVLAYDPNDILVNRNALFDYEMANPPWLEYIIRFQNTGNTYAYYVRVDNKISEDLQLNTFEFINSSHACNIEYSVTDSLMKFTFNNIMLLPSVANEPASHGFVRYRIKPKNTLAPGDTIRSSAGIYFDYNPPVLTNTATTGIISTTSLDETLSTGFSIYPNPVNEELNVEIYNPENRQITMELYNVYGQRVRVLYNGLSMAGNRKSQHSIGDLPKGVYLIKVTGVKSGSKRFVKL